MATSTDGHGYFLLFGVLQRANNVVFVFGLDYESWVHVVINLIGGRRILVLVVLVCLRSLQELIPCYASDSSHDFNVSMSGSSHGKEQMSSSLYTFCIHVRNISSPTIRCHKSEAYHLVAVSFSGLCPKVEGTSDEAAANDACGTST